VESCTNQASWFVLRNSCCVAEAAVSRYDLYGEGVTKWLLRDPEAVRASSTPLPFADSEGSGSPPPQPIEEQLSSIAMEDVTEQTSPEPIKDSNNSSGATDNGDNSVQQRPSLTGRCLLCPAWSFSLSKCSVI